MSPVVDGYDLHRMAIIIAFNGGVTFVLAVWVAYLLAVTVKMHRR